MNAIEKIPCTPSIGTDVEGFLMNDNSGRFVPCVGLVPGTKDAPHQLDKMPTGFCIQEDNVMVEFNVPPAQGYRAFAKNITGAVKAIQKAIPDGHTVIYKPDNKFAAKDLRSPQARTIGCEPDFNAYTGGSMRVPPSSTGVWRGAGGHIHLGGDFQCPDFVAALFCDLSLGISQNMTGYKKDMRHQFYGQPGIFRPKPYGIEWRSPSSAWINNSDKYSHVGDIGIRLARWMTDLDARELQTIFRKIDWPRVRKYLQFTTTNFGDRVLERTQILDMAIQAGMPL